MSGLFRVWEAADISPPEMGRSSLITISILTVLVVFALVCIWPTESAKFVPIHRKDKLPERKRFAIAVQPAAAGGEGEKNDDDDDDDDAKSKDASQTVVVEDDFIKSRVVNEHNFEYIINPGYEICRPHEGRPVFMLVYVHSAPENFKRRVSLRETWARRSMFRDMRVVFMMGDLDESDERLRDRLRLENAIYGDIVQETFVDAYRNLTYKGIMAMKWIAEYCPNSQYILKVDDDIIANVFILLRHLGSMNRHHVARNNTIMCLVWLGMVNKSYHYRNRFFVLNIHHF